MTRKKIAIITSIIIIVLLLVVVFVFYRNVIFGTVSSVNSIAVQSSQPLDKVPEALSKLLDFSGVKPYGMKKEILANGNELDTVQFNTSHLFGNYTIIGDVMTKTNGFVAQKVSGFSNNFKLVFNKEGTQVTVSASQNTTSLKEPNTITVVLNQPSNLVNK